MRRIAVIGLTICALTAGVLELTAKDEQAGAEASDESKIRQAVADYIEAFNQHDSAALARLWSPEAVYLDRATHAEARGRMAIAERFSALFKEQPDLKLSVNTESIQFLSPNVAIEHGISKFLRPNAESDETEYSAVYVKRDGQWLLDRVTDNKQQSPPSHYEQLKALEWMVGKWTDKEGAGVEVEADCHWTKNQNYLVRSYAFSVRDRVEMSGMQVIGWDPAAKTIRSWTFDADGTFAEATWTRNGDSWFMRNIGVVADGRRASMVNVMTPVDENSFTWQTIERTIGGELLPNIDQVLIVRQ